MLNMENTNFELYQFIYYFNLRFQLQSSHFQDKFQTKSNRQYVNVRNENINYNNHTSLNNKKFEHAQVNKKLKHQYQKSYVL